MPHPRQGKTVRDSLLICALLIASLSAQAQRMVFAHYMLTNQDYQGDTDPTEELKIAAYEREIKEAQAVGIDGFALNADGCMKPITFNTQRKCSKRAVRLNSGFKPMFSADMCCGNGVDDVEDMMRRFAHNGSRRNPFLQGGEDVNARQWSKAINPFGKSDWEGVGVEPNVRVRAADALDIAVKMAQVRVEKKQAHE